ncbi:hypothetical protein ACROYT_G029941 [Oculina patagonica]
MDIKSLANKINSYFVGLTDHFSPLCQGDPPLSVPDEFFISEYEAYRSLSSLQVSKATGPDIIPNRVLKDFALELAPLIRDIYNQSLREGYIPSLLKSSIVSPIPEVTPPGSIEKDLRPISLTCTVAKVMEGFTCSRLIPQLDGKIDPRQYSRKGHSTTDALLYMLQAIYEAVDSGEACARVFFADFSKGFDLIDHTILMQELAELDVHPAMVSWIAAFLTNRKQAVRVGGTLSGWLPLKGGVPQGTKLGVILFMVMTNKLLSDWRLHIKYVDDTSALEIIPRNSVSLLNFVASDIHNFAETHNMRLNPAKCKEMRINFLHNTNCLINPIVLGDNVIECVNTYKILGVIMDKDLKWNCHIDYTTKKAFWQAIPGYLSDAIERIQKRALHIIYPEAESYAHALQLAQLVRMDTRREDLCGKYMNQMKSDEHPIHHLLPRPALIESKYNISMSASAVYTTATVQLHVQTLQDPTTVRVTSLTQEMEKHARYQQLLLLSPTYANEHVLQVRNPTSKTERELQRKFSDLKKLGNLSETEYWKLRPSDSTPASFYGLPKIHNVELKQMDDHFTLPENTETRIPLRPINSCIGAPTYELSKYLASLLKHLVNETEYSVKNDKQFAEFVSDQEVADDELVVSFDVVSLFTSIPIDMAIDIV